MLCKNTMFSDLIIKFADREKIIYACTNNLKGDERLTTNIINKCTDSLQNLDSLITCDIIYSCIYLKKITYFFEIALLSTRL